MKHEIILQTERLLLKSITPKFVHQLFKTLSDEQISDYMGFSAGDLEFYRSMHEKGMETFRISGYHFLLVKKTDDRPIGECGFHTWSNLHRRAELFYFLRNEIDKKQGFMGEAIPQVLQFGFQKLNLHRIEALVAADNTPSLRLLHKNGFKFEGTMREDYQVNGINEDSDCYSLLKWEFEKKENN